MCCAAGASAQEREATGRYTHDGFYLRMSLGLNLGALSRSVEAEVSDVVGYESDSDISGGGLGLELTIGGTPATGFVVAGTWLGAGILDAVIERDDGSELELEEPLNFAMIGITLDGYVRPKAGFHLGGTLGPGVAGARLPEDSLFDYIGGWGWAIALHMGYDWWIGEEWSLGVLGRLIGARLSGEDEEEEITASEDDTYGALSLLFTAVHH